VSHNSLEALYEFDINSSWCKSCDSYLDVLLGLGCFRDGSPFSVCFKRLDEEFNVFSSDKIVRVDYRLGAKLTCAVRAMLVHESIVIIIGSIESLYSCFKRLSRLFFKEELVLTIKASSYPVIYGTYRNNTLFKAHIGLITASSYNIRQYVVEKGIKHIISCDVKLPDEIFDTGLNIYQVGGLLSL